jgi:hypothetical protein
MERSGKITPTLAAKPESISFIERSPSRFQPAKRPIWQHLGDVVRRFRKCAIAVAKENRDLSLSLIPRYFNGDYRQIWLLSTRRRNNLRKMPRSCHPLPP